MARSLPDTISSPEDVTSLILELREYSRWLTQTAIKKRAGAKKLPAEPTLAPSAKAFLQTFDSSLTPASLDTALRDLERLRTSSKTLVITLADVPNDAVKQQIVAWCRKELASDVLVSFQFNATLLGGMVVRSGSRIFDWSFRRQIFAAKDTFPEVLRRV